MNRFSPPEEVMLLLPPSAAPLALAAMVLAVALGAAPAWAGSITGVCPDGSIFVVQRAASIPCSNAKVVEPHEIPPVRPELLPNPYTWEVYNEGADPNNPYNAIDAARQVRALASEGKTVVPPQAHAEAAPLPGGGSTSSAAPSSLGLSDEEVRDLFLIVELSQEAAPASFLKETADGQEAFALSFAASPAFAERLRAEHPRGGELAHAPILLFSAVARRAESLHPNFTFTQRHLAFSPEAGNEAQLGVLLGTLGELAEGEVVLGWVALPEQMALHEPIGVYWNDRHLETVFTP